MTMAFRKSSRKLFSSAAALVLGLQIAPLVTLEAQDRPPAPLSVQNQARPISAQRRVERRQQRQDKHDPSSQVTEPPAEPTSPAQANFQPLPVPTATYNKSEVQRELEKLYQQNGRTVPELIDVRQSMGETAQSSAAPSAPPAGGQAQAAPAAQPQQYQPPAQAQPISQSTPTPPKKKGLLSKWFKSEDNSGPTQPPVEPPYTPPQNSQLTAPPVLAQQPAQPLMQPPVQQNSGRPNYGFLFEDETAVPQATVQTPVPAALVPVVPVAPQTPAPLPQMNLQPVQPALVAQPPAASGSDGFEAPLFVDDASQPQQAAPQAGLPSIDFNAPIPEPGGNQIELGEAAPLPGAVTSQVATPAVSPAAPKDPFSDDALFPSEAPVAATQTPPSRDEAGPELQVPDQPAQEAAPPEAEVVQRESGAVEPESPVGTPTTESENPYSGLTLDTEPVSTPVLKTATPAPLEVPSTVANETVTNELDRESTPDLIPPPREEGSEGALDVEPPLVVDSATPPAKLSPVPHGGAGRTQAKLEMIASRKGLKGLKGFCPVALRDHRDLVDAQSQYRVVYNERTYYLSSSESVRDFHLDPAKYAPAARGCDVIHLAITGEELEGSLDHAVWYKGRLYLFNSAETMETFVASPNSHATLD